MKKLFSAWIALVITTALAFSQTIPCAPSSLTATAVSSSQINLAWVDNSNSETDFMIERAASGGGPWTQIATVGAGVTGYSSIGLSAATIYYYRLLAYNAAGESAWSNTANATTSASGGSGGFGWSSAYGGTSDDYGWAVAVDPVSGGFVLTGSFGGPVDFGGGALQNFTGSNLVIAKYTEAGAHVWSKGFGGPGSGRPLAVAVDASGYILVTGWFTSTIDFGGGPLSSGSTSNPDIFVVKFSSAGAHVWSKKFGSSVSMVTLNPVESGRAIDADSSGNVIVGGSFLGTVNFGGSAMTSVGDLGFQDGFLAKFASADGAHIWSKQIGTDGQNDAVNGVAVESSGNVVVTGGFEGTVNFGGGAITATATDVFVAKYNSAGTHTWSKKLGGSLPDLAKAVAVDSSGNVAIIGTFGGTVDFGGGQLISSGYQDIFVAKLSASGAHVWSKRFGGSLGLDSGNGVAIDASGNVLVTGFFAGTTDFGGGQKVCVGGWDIFVAKYSSAGAHVWSRQVGGTSIDEGNSIAVNGAGHCAITGRFFETVNFGGSPMTSSGRAEIYLAKYLP